MSKTLHKMIRQIVSKGRAEYSESELVLPALLVIKSNGGTCATEKIVDVLEHAIAPVGKDAEKLDNRKDTHFSQKVRNLKSHNTLKKLKLASYSPSLGFILTASGLKKVEELKAQIYESIEQGLKPNRKLEVLSNAPLEILIEEGRPFNYTSIQRTRSIFLRKEAIKSFRKQHGKIFCEVCGFSFESRYGKIGKGFIEMHHARPIFLMGAGKKLQLSEALKSVRLVCSNCHRMIHRKKNRMLTIEQLKQFLKKVEVRLR